MRYKAICLDLYGTLVNTVQDLTPAGFASVLEGQGVSETDCIPIGEAFEPALREQFREFVDEDLALRPTFPRVADMFRQAFDELAGSLSTDIDSERAAIDLVDALGEVDLLPDVADFLDWADSRYPICIVSDGDDRMIYPALRRNGILRWPVVTSESFRNYKISLNSSLFPEALRILGTEPEETLHVGDQVSDVYGAKRAGLVAVYLNRRNRPLELVEADIEVPGFTALRDYLERH